MVDNKFEMKVGTYKGSSKIGYDYVKKYTSILSEDSDAITFELTFKASVKISKADFNRIELDLEAIKDVNALDSDGETPLTKAIKVENSEYFPYYSEILLKLLLNKGANPDQRDAKGRTALSYTTCRHATKQMILWEVSSYETITEDYDRWCNEDKENGYKFIASRGWLMAGRFSMWAENAPPEIEEKIKKVRDYFDLDRHYEEIQLTW